MLLRRITKHVKDQNWLAVFIDFAIVVVGILIAFQITEWNESRISRSAERNHLISLENEAIFSIESLEKSHTQLNAQQAARQLLYQHIKNPGDELVNVTSDELLQGALLNIERMDISQVTFDALTNSGQLSLIADTDLINELQVLDTLVKSAYEVEGESLQFTFNQSDPFLIEEMDMENVFNANLVTGEGEDEQVLEWIDGTTDIGLSDEVLRSSKFKNLVLFRAELTRGRLKVIRSLIEQYEKVRSLIHARQKNLGVS